MFLTSRPSRIPTKLTGFSFYLLNPFTDDNIKEFLSRWFPDQEDFRLRIFEKITGDKTLHAFCRSPLFLTLYTILASRFSLDLLPTRRTDIYSKISSLLLGEWDSTKAVKNEFSISIKDALLQYLAFDLHQLRMKQVPYSYLQRVIDKFFDNFGKVPRGYNRKEYLQKLADEVIYRSSLIKEANRHSDFEFAHLSFQEFFCAKYLMRTTDEKAIQQRLFDEWYKNTLVFYFGIKESMDGIQIPTGKVSEGKRISLIEFLTEATFTSKETKLRVYETVGKDLLYSTKISARELEMCAQAEGAFLEVLRPSVVNGDFSGITFNYLKLLVIAGTSKARSIMGAEKGLFCRLTDRELLILLCDAIALLHYQGWADDMRSILDHLKRERCLYRSKSDWDRDEYIQRFRVGLNKAVLDGYLKKRDSEWLIQLLKRILS